MTMISTRTSFAALMLTLAGVMLALAGSASATVLFMDDFESYTAGAALPDAGAWSAHSSSGNLDVQVVSAFGSQQLQGGAVSGSAEDVNAAFTGAPITTGTVYSGATITFTAAPSGHTYFHHFIEGTGTFRCRVYAADDGNGAVELRLGGTSETPWATALALNTPYRIVIGYNIDTGAANLWVDPTMSSDTNLSYSDSTTSISGIAFRQSSGDPGWLADDMIAATTFNEVMLASGPTITAINPSTGNTLGGTSVTITGTNLSNVTSVTFGGTAGTNLNVVSATEVSVTTPAATAAGMVDVVVSDGSNPDATATNGFTYTVPDPTITMINPSMGVVTGGTSVTITGTELTGVTSVTFGGTAGTNMMVVSDTEITVDTPAGNAGMVDVVITDGTSPDTATNGFEYILPTPSITSIAPTSGTESGGTVVTITGTGFTGATSATFGGTAGTSFTVVSDTEITVSTPAGTGMVDVVVSNGSTADGTLANGYTYTTPTPVIASLTPTMGSVSGGTVVVITGTDLTNVTSVTFGGTAGTSMTVDSATQITVTTPAGSAGAVDVVVSDGTNPDSTLTGGFTYTAAMPVITSISPTSGPETGGTVVTVTGTDLDTATSVTFGGTAGTNMTIVSASEITVQTPAGTGMVDVVVTDGTTPSTLTNGFSYNAAMPMISAISPASGTTAGGTTVTVTGTDLAGVTSVTFDGTAGTSLTIVDATTLTVVTPAGTAGAVNVVIDDGTNTDTLANGFTYVAPSTKTSSDCSITSGSSNSVWLILCSLLLGVAIFASPRKRAHA